MVAQRETHLLEAGAANTDGRTNCIYSRVSGISQSDSRLPMHAVPFAPGRSNGAAVPRDPADVSTRAATALRYRGTLPRHANRPPKPPPAHTWSIPSQGWFVLQASLSTCAPATARSSHRRSAPSIHPRHTPCRPFNRSAKDRGCMSSSRAAGRRLGEWTWALCRSRRFPACVLRIAAVPRGAAFFGPSVLSMPCLVGRRRHGLVMIPKIYCQHHAPIGAPGESRIANPQNP
jgi:hypothetical protein